MTAPKLEIRDVGKIFRSGGQTIVAVKSMSLAFPAEKPKLITLAGESGCGKTTLALMALGFVTPTSGHILYRGIDISVARGGEFRKFRRSVQAVFQNPYETFNPVYRIRSTLSLAARLRGLSPRSREGREAIERALARVRLDPERVSAQLSAPVERGPAPAHLDRARFAARARDHRG